MFIQTDSPPGVASCLQTKYIVIDPLGALGTGESSCCPEREMSHLSTHARALPAAVPSIQVNQHLLSHPMSG